MKRVSILYILIIALALFLNGCGDGGDGDDAKVVKLQKPGKSRVAKKVEAEKRPERDVTLPDRPSRNPFQSHMAKAQAVRPRTGPPPTPLQCCDVNTFRVQVVVTDVDAPYALVLGTNGETYTLKKDVLIGIREGKVVKITSRSIIVEEITRNLDGDYIGKATVEMVLPVKD